MKRALTLLIMGTIFSGVAAWAMTGARPVSAQTAPSR
jgi:hypothetical protein